MAESEFGHDDLRYTQRLQAARWRNSQLIHGWFGRRAASLVRGRTLEVGCGIGRLLPYLGKDAVGIDTNPHSVAVAVREGLTALTAEEFPHSRFAIPGGYGTLLFAHVLEHMTTRRATNLVGTKLTYLTPGGRVVVIVPQEAGFRADPTHVESIDLPEIESIAQELALEVTEVSSFPFPRFLGRIFRFNETAAVLHRVAVDA